MIKNEKPRLFLSLALTLIGGFIPAFLVILDIFTYQALYFTHAFLQSNETRIERVDYYKLEVS